MDIERQIDTETRIFDLAELFKVFGDSTRIRILYELFEEPELNVTDIADRISMTSSAVSHQLKTLRVSNLIKSRKEGKTVYYSLADDHVKTILFMGMEHIEEKRGS